MRRSLLLPPIALLASACALSRSPATAALTWSPPPMAENVELPARSDALSRWALPPGDPWAPYAKYTLLAALTEAPRTATLPDVEALAGVQRAREAASRVAASGLPPGTLWIVDMRGAQSVAFGTGLSRAGAAVTLVPTFNNWPAPAELVPAEETLAALVSMAPARSPDAEHSGAPVFLLDAWRMAYRDDEPADDAYDNRYMLSRSDFPDADELLARGIHRIVYVVDGSGTIEEDDLNTAFFEWQDRGLQIATLDIDPLREPPTYGRWDELWVGRRLRVRPRLTVLQMPDFYARARGGFGGVHARPFVGVAHGGGG